MLQIYVLMKIAGAPSTGAIVSIGISALTTGFASAIIAFDKDLDAQSRKNQPKCYGELFSVIFVVVIAVIVANT